MNAKTELPEGRTPCAEEVAGDENLPLWRAHFALGEMIEQEDWRQVVHLAKSLAVEGEIKLLKARIERAKAGKG